jgi:hypothetical protein
MQLTVRRTLIIASLTLGLLAACASDNPPAASSDTGTNDALDATTGTVRDGNSPSTSDAPSNTDTGGVCVPHCTTDLECQQSCKPPQVGTSCCDKIGGICYAATTCQSSSGGDGGTD